MSPPSTTTLPAVFVSHGAPTLLFDLESPAYNALTDWPTRLGLDRLGRSLRGVVVISAHWETPTPMLSAADEPETLHDFDGFPSRCYDLFYICEGAPALAEQVAEHLHQNPNLPPIAIDRQRGLDHGAWIPLMLAFPAGDIPLVQLSVQPNRSWADHVALGKALAPLRQQGVLILGSGGAVHNLDHWAYEDTRIAPWAHRFDDALADALHSGNPATVEALLQTADGVLAHPTPEHILPLAVVMGAATADDRLCDLFRGFQDGSLSMAAYAFS